MSSRNSWYDLILNLNIRTFSRCYEIVLISILISAVLILVITTLQSLYDIINLFLTIIGFAIIPFVSIFFCNLLNIDQLMSSLMTKSKAMFKNYLSKDIKHNGTSSQLLSYKMLKPFGDEKSFKDENTCTYESDNDEVERVSQTSNLNQKAQSNKIEKQVSNNMKISNYFKEDINDLISEDSIDSENQSRTTFVPKRISPQNVIKTVEKKKLKDESLIKSQQFPIITSKPMNIINRSELKECKKESPFNIYENLKVYRLSMDLVKGQEKGVIPCLLLYESVRKDLTNIYINVSKNEVQVYENSPEFDQLTSLLFTCHHYIGQSKDTKAENMNVVKISIGCDIESIFALALIGNLSKLDLLKNEEAIKKFDSLRVL